MTLDAFDFGVFFARSGATPKERSAVRQDLVRGLKDYFESIYGYDRYGAETVLLLPERMNKPYVYGFAVRRMLHDRRLAQATKVAAALRVLDVIDYGSDQGLPFDLLGAVAFLLQRDALTIDDLRYALVVSAGEVQPFRGMAKMEAVGFVSALVGLGALPAMERGFWVHTLIARHQDQPGAHEMIGAVLGSTDIPREMRSELCRAWINFRQPHLSVPTPEPRANYRAAFVAEHLPFWVAHVPSWPSLKMVHDGLVWLGRLGADPVELARTYINYRGTFAEQLHAGVADLIGEHAHTMPEAETRSLIDRGIAISGSSPTRRRFYRLGTDLYGADYLSRASTDSANSVRQWAAKQLHHADE